MPSPAPEPDGPFQRINAACQSFTGEWTNGRPDLPSYLLQVAEDEQRTLLRNLLEYEIKKRRAAGESPSSREYIELLPQHAEVVRRVFLDASSISVASSFEPTPAATAVHAPAASRLGEYRLVRELGHGGMGFVFEAVHLGRGHRVALKTLPAVSGDSLLRFKREFRALADVTHPNLVGLRTLESDGGQWFITMDLLDGGDFLSHVRPGRTFDEARLRAALAQLAAGAMALHARGIVHRDLKPGNVMVTARGRVVILDFGLVAELERSGARSAAGAGGGTPGYMAPEQAAGGEVGSAADWYAVGVMLYEALAGKRPFVGEAYQVMAVKQREEAPPLPADAPADLAGLCMRLLARDPAARPDPLQIAGAVATAPTAATPVGSADQLIGRESQQAALAASLADLRRTRSPVPVFIKGRSGEGKTSLAESFLAPLRKDGTLAVMSGRCYDRESVPFKALDTLIDALTSHLRSLPAAEAALLLPDDIALLAEVFPVLRRCDVVAKAPRGRMDALDQQQVRQRAFAALRLLLERIGERTPLVWFIDDLQWGDTDSAGALFEILRPPAAPPVLFLGSFRSDEADASPFLTEWAARQQQNGVDFGDRSVSVGPLSLEEAAQLVVNVVGRDTPAVRQRAVQFHAQTGGNPFLLTEVAGCFDPDADAFHATDIHGVLARKLAQLPPEAGPLLDAVSVSGQAVDLAEAAAAAGLSESPEEALARMRNVRLLRIVGAKVDTYHDRIRYAVLDRMPEGDRKTMHRSLAEVIARTAGGLSEEEIAATVEGKDTTAKREALARVYDLAYHFDAAGDTRCALAYSLVAARQARDQFALDVAAQQYAIAERNAKGSSAKVKLLIARSLADGFIVMGRYDESRQRLDFASQLAEEQYDIADIWGIRGELHFKLGEIGNSIECFHSGIRTLGIHVPRTFVGYVWGVAKQTVVQAFHSCVPIVLHRGSHDASSDLCNHLLARLEWALYSHNALKLVWASLVGLNRAERLPRSKALSVNYVVHGNDMAVLGWHRRADRFYQSAVKLSEELNDRWGATLARSHWGLGKLGAADYRRTLELCIPATAEMAKLNDVFEYHAALMFTSIAHYGLGDLASAFNVAKVLFDSCVRVSDNYVGTWAAFQVARCTRGAAEVDVLYNCVHVLPGNTLSKVNSLTALAYFHLHRGRTEEATHVLDEALNACIRTAYLVSFNSNVPNEAAAAHRLHVHHLESNGADSRRACRRWMRMAKWANRVSWLMSPERPYALRELSLAYEHRGRIRKAWKLARKSVAIAEKQKAKYEHAQSLVVQGRLAKQLGYPEAEQQIRDGQAEIDRIEGELDAVLNARPT